MKSALILSSVLLALSQLRFVQGADGDNDILERIDEVIRINESSSPEAKFELLSGMREGLNSEELETLNKFIELKDLNYDTYKHYTATCNRRGRKILRDVYDILDRHEGEPREVDRFVNGRAIQHATDCIKFYINSFDKHMKDASMEKFKGVKEFTKAIEISRKTDGRLTADKLILNDRIMALNIRYIGGESDARLAHRALLSAASINNEPYYRHLYRVFDEQPGQVASQEAKVKMLFSKYLVSPCKDYVEQYGPDFFLPMALDLTVLDPSTQYCTNMGDEKTNNFYEGWRDHRLCTVLLRYQEDFIHDILRVVKDSFI